MSDRPEPQPSQQRFRWLPVIVSGLGIDFLGSQVVGIATGSASGACERETT
jgi:hypothetical protein